MPWASQNKQNSAVKISIVRREQLEAGIANVAVRMREQEQAEEGGAGGGEVMWVTPPLASGRGSGAEKSGSWAFA